MLIEGRIASVGSPADVLTPEAIHQLYGVRVALLRAADGSGLVFRPTGRGTTCSP
jgi:iron complex transport system ATP-binding protein